jgi:hypothetical protein
MAARSKTRTVFNRSSTGNMGSNPARGMDVCPRFFCVALSCVGVTLRRADPPSKECYQMSKNRFISFRSQILNRNRPEGLIRIYLRNNNNNNNNNNVLLYSNFVILQEHTWLLGA